MTGVWPVTGDGQIAEQDGDATVYCSPEQDGRNWPDCDCDERVGRPHAVDCSLGRAIATGLAAASRRGGAFSL